MAAAVEVGTEVFVPFLDAAQRAKIRRVSASKTQVDALPGRADKPLGLAIVVVDGGFSVKARGGNIAPGCRDTGPGSPSRSAPEPTISQRSKIA